MEWLKKYWIVPVVIVIVIAVYLYFTKNSRSANTGEDDTARLANLQTNSEAFKNWGLNVTFNPQYNAVLIKAQGNGNATEFVWSKQRDIQFYPNEITQQVWEIPNNYDLYSDDGDFYINIRSVRIANSNVSVGAFNQNSASIELEYYCVVSIWDPSENYPDVLTPLSAKAAVLINWTTNNTSVIKQAPAPSGTKL
jgi:hypothetical protein